MYIFICTCTCIYTRNNVVLLINVALLIVDNDEPFTHIM